MPILTGFQNLADAGLFGAPQNQAAQVGIDFNNAGSGSSILGDILNVANFGLDVFQTVRGPQAPISPASSLTAVSTVPTPGGSIGRFAGNFAPQASQAAMRLPGGMAAGAGGVVAAARIGVAFVLRKIKANTGIRITTKKIVSAIRQFGPSAVAVWAGVTMAELMIVWDRGSRRVKRRFTKRDRSRGRSYIRHLKRQADELKDLGCGPKTRTRKRSC